LLQQFLTTASPIFEGPKAGAVQANAVERLALTLKHFPSGEDVAMSTVHALLNTLYSHNTTANENTKSREQSILIQENVVVAISRIACVFKGEKVLPTHPITIRINAMVCSQCSYELTASWCCLLIDHSDCSVHVGATNSTPQPQVGLRHRVQLDGHGTEWH